jgi:hypothetical protein
LTRFHDKHAQKESVGLTKREFKTKLSTILESLHLGVPPKIWMFVYSISHIKVTKGLDKIPRS